MISFNRVKGASKGALRVSQRGGRRRGEKKKGKEGTIMIARTIEDSADSMQIYLKSEIGQKRSEEKQQVGFARQFSHVFFKLPRLKCAIRNQWQQSAQK